MTRALITDEVRTGHSMGPVQLGYVSYNVTLTIVQIHRKTVFKEFHKNKKTEIFLIKYCLHSCHGLY